MTNTIRTKGDVQFHRDGWHGSPSPALNVKVYNFPVSADRVAEHFKCSRDAAQKAVDFAWESACENFWEQVQETAEYYLGSGAQAYSEGRMGGWLIVKGLPSFESWDAVMLSKWRRFAASVDEDITYRISWDAISGDIEANEWTRDGSERFNFVDTPSGPKCVADLNAALAKTKAEFLGGTA